MWPILVVLFRRRTLLVLLLAILIAEPLVRGLATAHFATYEPIYYLTPFRLDSLAAGSLLALLTEDGATFYGQRWGGWATLAISPFFLLCTIANRQANSVAFNSLSYSFFAVIYFCLVAWVTTLHSGFFYTALSAKPLTYLGRISYGIYLFHMPFHQLMLRALHQRDPFPLDFLLTLAFASVSYHLFERPITTYARRRTDDTPTECEWCGEVRRRNRMVDGGIGRYYCNHAEAREALLTER